MIVRKQSEDLVRQGWKTISRTPDSKRRAVGDSLAEDWLVGAERGKCRQLDQGSLFGDGHSLDQTAAIDSDTNH